MRMAKKAGKLTVKEMMTIIGKLCGTSSIAYMNMQMYCNADEDRLRVLFDSIVGREIACIKTDIEQKEAEIEQLQERLKEFEKYN